SSGYTEHDLVPEGQVKRYKSQRAKVRAQEQVLEAFVATAKIEVARAQARDAARYMMAVRRVATQRVAPAKAASDEGLDPETLMPWGRYLSTPQKIEHPYLNAWFELMSAGGGSDKDAKRAAEDFQKLILDVIAEKTAIIAANEASRRDYKPDPGE